MIPGIPDFFQQNIVPKFPDPNTAKLSDVLGPGLNMAFIISGFLMLIWLVWGVLQYIFAGGDKEGLAKARSRITWAIVGFLLVVIAFAVSQYAQQIFFPNGLQQTVKTITVPPPP